MRPNLIAWCAVLVAAAVLSGSIAAQDPAPPKPSPDEKKPADPPKDRFDRKDVPAVAFSLPKTWKARKTDSPSRAAEYEIPGKEPATCTVSWFGERGAGPVDANIDRWVGQFTTEEKPQRETLEPAKGIKATLVEIGGRYVAAMTPGAPEKHDKPGWRLHGAILEVPGGTFYLKLVGPDATVAAARDDFKAWVKSFRMESK